MSLIWRKHLLKSKRSTLIKLLLGKSKTQITSQYKWNGHKLQSRSTRFSCPFLPAPPPPPPLPTFTCTKNLPDLLYTRVESGCIGAERFCVEYAWYCPRALFTPVENRIATGHKCAQLMFPFHARYSNEWMARPISLRLWKIHCL